MVMISEALMLEYYSNSNDTKIRLQDKLNKKVYTVKDSTLSYRQINSLGASDMIQDERENLRGWRKFSFKDLVYLYTIIECRKYGITNEKLQELKRDFFTKANKTHIFSEVDHVLLLVLGTIKISLLINSTGNSWFVDMNYQTFIDEKNNSYVYINFNEIVRKVWQLTRSDDSKFPKYRDWGDLMVDYFKSSQLTGKENEILNILRNKDYSLITIKKKDKNTYNVYGELDKNTHGMTEMELLGAMKEKDFTNIKITKRNGKIVSYKLEDVYKI